MRPYILKEATWKNLKTDRFDLAVLPWGATEAHNYHLRSDARDTLRKNADWLKNNPSARIEIEGHCDERGTNEYNLALGAKRAQSAKDYLVTLGISAERLSTISYGEEVPGGRQLRRLAQHPPGE